MICRLTEQWRSKGIIDCYAKSLTSEAIKKAKVGDIKSAHEKLKEFDNLYSKHIIIKLICLLKKLKVNIWIITLLIVHSQDHLMTAIAFRDLAGEMVDLYEKLYQSNALNA